MSNVKFTQLPNQATLADNTILPTVNLGTNFTVTAANLKAYTSNVSTLTASGNITGNYILGNGSQLTGIVSSYGNANVTSLLGSFGSNTISTTGNVTAAYVLGNGSQLTGLPATYSNSNVTTLLASFGSNTLSTTGNVTAGYFVGNGSLLTGLPASYSNANVVTLLSSFGSNAISTTGNVTAGYLIGNGSQLTGITSTYGNAQVATFLNSFGSNAISTTGNVTAGYVAGNGSLLTNLTGANITGTVANATFATSAGTATSATSATTAGTVTTAAQPNITSVGTLTVVNTSGDVSAVGNVTGAYIIGNGSQLTGITSSYGNAQVATFLNAFGSNSISTTGNITTGNLAVTANITSYTERTTSQGNTSTSFTPIYSNGIVQRITATANFTLQAPSGMTAGQSITLIITQDATGSRLMTPNGVYKFAYGVKGLSTTASSIDMLSIFYDGSNYLCNLVKGYVA